MIRRLLKYLFPTEWFDILRNTSNILNYFVFLKYDHPFKSLRLGTSDTGIYQIIRQYHRLEKAMSKEFFDSSRGKRAAITLLKLLEKNRESNVRNNIQYSVAWKVLDKYIVLDETRHSALRERLDKIFIHRTEELTVGVERTLKNDFLKGAGSNFQVLSNSRKSIRYFSRKEVPDTIVLNALDIAKKTPSVCNRQGWHTWLIKDKSIISEFRKVHNGFAQKRQNLQTLLVITFDMSAFDYPVERNQGYVDGGLYSMSVLYALTSLGVASCPLNSNLHLSDKKRFKKLIGISDNYRIVMFIAVGNYLEENVSPISYRSPVKDKMTIV